ncbi:MAG: glycosyltransferase [Myxococcota bacterium]|nr:glycosyltransferase [Myxococcota bacterium]
MSPRVSVLLPVHDAEETLAASLETVARQTLEDHEVVLVLNGCSDRSPAVAQRYADRDPRVRVLTLESANLVSALNYGLESCRATLVARHDADDLMEPQRLSLQVSALEANPQWDVVTCGVRCSGIGGHEPGAGMLRCVQWLNGLGSPEAIRQARFIDAPVVHPAVMFRRDVVVSVSGYRDGDFPEDHDLWLRLLERGTIFGRIPEVLVDWRDRADRFTRTDPRCRDDARRALVHRHLLSGPLKGGRRCRIWGAGPYGRRHARDLHALSGLVDDLIDIDPKKIGRQVAGGLPVVGSDSVVEPDGRLILIGVASPGARQKIEGFLTERGHQSERDYLALQ